MKAYATLGQFFNELDELERKAKIAVLWFDEVLIQSFSKNFYCDYLIDCNNISSDYENILRNIFVDVSEPVDIYAVNSIDKKLLEVSKKAISDFFGTDYRGKARDVYLERNYVTYCIERWNLLNSIEQCAFIGRDVEHKIIKNAYMESHAQSGTHITELIDIAFPSVSELSWNKVLELRNHRFIESFRSTITDLLDSLESSNQVIVREIIGELVDKGIKDVFTLVTPSTGKQVVKGIASNIPLPIPVNPVSIASSAVDIAKDIAMQKKFGWLFFYVENLM